MNNELIEKLNKDLIEEYNPDVICGWGCYCHNENCKDLNIVIDSHFCDSFDHFFAEKLSKKYDMKITVYLSCNYQYYFRHQKIGLYEILFQK